MNSHTVVLDTRCTLLLRSDCRGVSSTGPFDDGHDRTARGLRSVFLRGLPMRYQRILCVLTSLVALCAINVWAQGPAHLPPPLPRPRVARKGNALPSSPIPHQPSITAMKLLTPTTGWVTTSKALFWTIDGGV